MKTTKKKRSKSRTILILLMALVLTVTGALAFLVDHDKKENKFTVGEVNIDVLEPIWDKTNPNGTYDGIMPNQRVEKDPQIKNTGENSAYVYILVSIPKLDNIDVASITETVTKNDFQLFTYDVNENWTLVDSKIDADDANNYYLYAYKPALNPGETTLTPVFSTVKLGNITKDQIPSSEVLEIDIQGYAIQSSLKENEAKDAVEAWNIFATQENWEWPSEPVGRIYTFVSYDGRKIKNKNLYDSLTSVSMLEFPISGISDDVFEGWIDENGVFHEPGSSTSVDSLYVKEPDGTILNPNPCIIESTKEIYSGTGMPLPVKLIPINENSTAMIQREGKTTFTKGKIESYNEGYSVITDTYGYTSPASSYEYWYVYGLKEHCTIEELMTKYVTVQGDGYAVVTATHGNEVGTGSSIKVYANNGDAPDTLIEEFTIIIYGDINGDAEISKYDDSILSCEALSLTCWSIDGIDEYCSYKVKAADLRTDSIIDAQDKSLLNIYLNGEGTVNQTTGRVDQ